jgi:hypothetical protein
MKENRGRPKENIEKKMKYVIEFKDSRWHYDLNKYPRGPYLVEQLDTTYDKLEKLYHKLEKLKKPKYHENGRKKRITKSDRKKMELAEKAYWSEHYRLFPNERPKRRGRKPARG